MKALDALRKTNTALQKGWVVSLGYLERQKVQKDELKALRVALTQLEQESFHRRVKEPEILYKQAGMPKSLHRQAEVHRVSSDDLGISIDELESQKASLDELEA